MSENAPTIVLATFTGGYRYLAVPHGLIPPSPDIDIHDDGVRELISYNNGGSSWEAKFQFDTTRGTLSPGGNTLTWNSGTGTPSPLLSGTFRDFVLSLDRDLTDATSLNVAFTNLGPTFSIVGPTYAVSSSYQPPYAAPLPIAPLTEPFTSAPLPSGVDTHDGSKYHDAQFDGGGSLGLRVQLAPVIAS